jgi:oligopeptide/dipeptide ABC transporter ATP-binding protein
MSAPVLSVDGLVLRADGAPTALVDDVTLAVARGECVGVVGESGSGKTLTLRSLVGLLPAGVTQAAGTMRLAAPQGELRPTAPEQARGRGVGMVFQDPSRALNPLWRVGRTIAEPLRRHLGRSRRDARARVLELLDDVGINDPDRVARSYPHQLSGGQRQRVMIAAAIACEPDVLLCDEPTTALDVTTQARILTLLQTLCRERGVAVVFVSHDLGVIAQVADRVMVMYAGQIVEQGPTAAVLDDPRHPYTSALRASVPTFDAPRGRLRTIPGAASRAGSARQGCAFAPRCPLAQDDCRAEDVALAERDGRPVRCLHASRVPDVLRMGA